MLGNLLQKSLGPGETGTEGLEGERHLWEGAGPRRPPSTPHPCLEVPLVSYLLSLLLPGFHLHLRKGHQLWGCSLGTDLLCAPL